MTLLEKTPLAIAEVAQHIKDLDEKKVLAGYLKKFSKLSKEEAVKLKEEIRALNNLKIKEAGIVKVADFIPQTPEEVNKIFTEVSLSEEEIKSIISKTKR
jgi:DNA-directed RNA polymerase subunit F